MPTVYLALLIPLILTGIFYYFHKHQFVWWEFFVPIFSVLIAVTISKAVIDHVSVQFTEYWGSTITSIYEEEPYNYWKTQTCSRQVACGTDSEGNTEYCTEYYDCSHQVDVGPSWSARTDIGEMFSITEAQHDELVKQFKTKKTAINSRRNYDARDRCVSSKGTKFEGQRVGPVSFVYKTLWNGGDETRKAYVSQHSYENRIKASDLTIFNIKMVNEKSADSLDLFKYPIYRSGGLFSFTEGLKYPTILGGNVSEKTQEYFRKLNGKFGVSNELRLWVLIFEDKPMSRAIEQENYWVNGNMNELVLCIGVKNNEIQWSHTFSWAYSDVLTVEVKNEVLNLYTYKDSIINRNSPEVIPITGEIKNKVLGEVGKKFPEIIPISLPLQDSIVKIKSRQPMLTEETLYRLYNYLNENLHRFERRDFSEFDYLTVEPSRNAKIFVYLFALIISIITNILVIRNEIYDKSHEKNKNRWRY